MPDDSMKEFYLPIPKVETQITDPITEIRNFATRPLPQIDNPDHLSEVTADFRQAIYDLLQDKGQPKISDPKSFIFQGELLNRDRFELSTDGSVCHIEKTTPGERKGQLEEKPVLILDFPIEKDMPIPEDPFNQFPLIGVKRFDDGEEEVAKPFKYSDSDELNKMAKMMKQAAFDTLVAVQTSQHTSLD